MTPIMKAPIKPLIDKALILYASPSMIKMSRRIASVINPLLLSKLLISSE